MVVYLEHPRQKPKVTLTAPEPSPLESAFETFAICISSCNGAVCNALTPADTTTSPTLSAKSFRQANFEGNSLELIHNRDPWDRYHADAVNFTAVSDKADDRTVPKPNATAQVQDSYKIKRGRSILRTVSSRSRSRNRVKWKDTADTVPNDTQSKPDSVGCCGPPEVRDPAPYTETPQRLEEHSMDFIESHRMATDNRTRSMAYGDEWPAQHRHEEAMKPSAAWTSLVHDPSQNGSERRLVDPIQKFRADKLSEQSRFEDRFSPRLNDAEMPSATTGGVPQAGGSPLSISFDGEEFQQRIKNYAADRREMHQHQPKGTLPKNKRSHYAEIVWKTRDEPQHSRGRKTTRKAGAALGRETETPNHYAEIVWKSKEKKPSRGLFRRKASKDKSAREHREQPVESWEHLGEGESWQDLPVYPHRTNAGRRSGRCF